MLFFFPCLFQCDRLTQIQTLMLIAYIVSFGLAGTHYPEGDGLVALGAIGKRLPDGLLGGEGAVEALVLGCKLRGRRLVLILSLNCLLVVLFCNLA